MRLIDADALKELFPDNGEGSWTYNITSKMYIDNAPTIEERPKGKWIEIHKGYICSNCNKYTITINDKHYCFKCGADMRKKDAYSMWQIMDEVMDTIKAFQPRLYDATLQKIRE